MAYQRYRFKLELANGDVMEGGAESRELCIDHIRHCLKPTGKPENDVVRGWYLGRIDSPLVNPLEVFIEQ